MTWKTLLFDSFIRGVGKTSAALVVCGVLGGVWTIFSTFNYSSKKLDTNESNEQNNSNNYNESNSNDDDSLSEYYKKDNESDSKFKNIFDKL